MNYTGEGKDLLNVQVIFFKQHNDFRLEEILEFDEDFFQNNFGMSLGNAQFILGRVKAEKKKHIPSSKEEINYKCKHLQFL